MADKVDQDNPAKALNTSIHSQGKHKIIMIPSM